MLDCAVSNDIAASAETTLEKDGVCILQLRLRCESPLVVLYGLMLRGLEMGVGAVVSLTVSRWLQSTWSVAWGCE